MDKLAIKVDNKFYFSIHEIDGGFDYSVYDINYRLIDGGVYDTENGEKILDVVNIIGEWDCPKGVINILDNSRCVEVDYDDLDDRVFEFESKVFSLEVAKRIEEIIKNSPQEKVDINNKFHSEER